MLRRIDHNTRDEARKLARRRRQRASYRRRKLGITMEWVEVTAHARARLREAGYLSDDGDVAAAVSAMLRDLR